MARLRKTKEELEFSLVQQLHLLRKACGGGFSDPWDFTEAINVAARVRVLVHHHGQSNSLLGQLGLRTGPYLNTLGPGNTLVIPSAFGPFPRFLAPYDPPWREKDLIELGDWWEDSELNVGGFVTSRKKLILTIANQDGGAHADADTEDWVLYLRRYHTTGWHHTHEDGTREPMLGWEYGTVRAIGFELVWSLGHNQPAYATAQPERYGDMD
jgi:hypothetical protein